MILFYLKSFEKKRGDWFVDFENSKGKGKGKGKGINFLFCNFLWNLFGTGVLVGS